MMNFTACILHIMLLEWLNQGGWGGRDVSHASGRGEVFTGFGLGGPKVRDHSEGLGVGGRITLIWTLGIDGANYIRLDQVRIQWRAFFFEHANEPSGSIKKTGFFWQSEWRPAFQVCLSYCDISTAVTEAWWFQLTFHLYPLSLRDFTDLTSCIIVTLRQYGVACCPSHNVTLFATHCSSSSSSLSR
jgi:hypothetical protein